MRNILLSLVVAFSFGTFSLMAQEAEQEQEGVQKVPQQEATADAGTDAVQTKAEVVPAAPKKISAVARLKEILPKPYNTPGWKEEQKLMLALGKYSFPCTDPAQDKDFFIKRQFAGQTAVLLAKADMISRIKTTAEAYRAYQTFNDSAIENSSTETMTNSLKTLSSGILLGATTMNQTEAWDGSKYEIAVMMVWSEKLEATTRGIWIEESPVQKPKENGKTLEEWLEKQEIASMCGPWQFVDKNGIRWFLGVAARSIEGLTGAAEIEARETAKLMAMGDALLALRGDIYASTVAEHSLKTKGNEQTLARKFISDLSESCKAEISGLGEVYSTIVTHPYTESEIYVSVYGISQESALQGVSAEDRTVLSEQIFNKGQTLKAGRAAANRQAINASKNNPKDFEEGAEKQRQKLQRQGNQRKQQLQNQKKGGKGVNGGADVDYNDF